MAYAGFLALLLALGVVVHSTLSQSQAFALSSIDITGLERTDRATLLGAANITPNMPLMLLDLARATFLMQDLPWVAEARIRRQWPNRIEIHVVEHHPRAMAMLEELWLLNANGVAFKRFASADHLVLPVLSGALHVDRAMAPNIAPMWAWRDVVPKAVPLFFARNKAVKVPEPAANVVSSCKTSKAAKSAHVSSVEALRVHAALSAATHDMFVVDTLHIDVDLGFSATLLLAPQAWPDAPPHKNHSVLVHLGRTPQLRLPVLCEVLRRLAGRRLVPEVIWLLGDTEIERVQVRLAGGGDAHVVHKSRNL